MEMECSMFDLSGRVIESGEFSLDQSGSAKLFLGKEMGSGVYFVELIGEGRRIVKKVVKL